MSATATTVLGDWLEGELADTRRVLERAVARTEALSGLLAFLRDAEADLGESVAPEHLEAAALKVGGERGRAEVAVLVEQMGEALHLA